MRSARGSSSVEGKGRRRGTRCMVRVPHDGHTSGRWSRSAAISASASGARNSLMPLRPTTIRLQRGNLALFLTASQGGCSLARHSPAEQRVPVPAELGGSQISSLLETLPGIASVLRSPVADALIKAIRGAVGLGEFDVEDAEELIRYAVRRGLIGPEEGDRVLSDIQGALKRKPPKAAAPRPKPAPKKKPAGKKKSRR